MLTAGPFELDPEAQRLTRGGVEVSLSGQPLAILALLIAAAGRVVTRAELKQTLWPNSERIDTERRLNTAMRALRAALGETAETPLYIETIRARGYRWIARDKPPRPQARWAIASATAAALLCAVAACAILLPQRSTAPLTGEQQGRYLRAASAAAISPQAAGAELAPLLTERPDYAPAHLLDAALTVQQWRNTPSPQTLAALRQALSAAHANGVESASLAAMDAELALKGDLDWRGAEHRYRAALEREPGNVEARRGLAWLLLNAGRRDEALTQVETLLGNAALTDALRADLGWLLLRARRPDLALSLCGIDSALPNLLACRHTALERTGDSAGARRAALAFMQAVGARGSDIADVRRGAPRTGYQHFLRWRAALFADDHMHWFQRAQVEAESGQTEIALAHLENAFTFADPSRYKLATTPEFDRLRGDPRFQRLLDTVERID